MPPLDPDTGSQQGMFPAVPAFEPSSEVRAVAEHLMLAVDDLRDLHEAVDAGDTSVGFFWDNAPAKQDEALLHDTLGKVVKAPPFWRCFSGIDVVVLVRRAYWDVFSTEQREAVVYHELKHIQIVGEKRAVKLAEHSVEEFTSVVARYGSYLPSRGRFLRAFSDWNVAQDAPDPSGR